MPPRVRGRGRGQLRGRGLPPRAPAPSLSHQTSEDSNSQSLYSPSQNPYWHAGTLNDPVEISSGNPSPANTSPAEHRYNTYEEWFGQYQFEFTPEHNQQPVQQIQEPQPSLNEPVRREVALLDQAGPSGSHHPRMRVTQGETFHCSIPPQIIEEEPEEESEPEEEPMEEDEPIIPPPQYQTPVHQPYQPPPPPQSTFGVPTSIDFDPPQQIPTVDPHLEAIWHNQQQQQQQLQGYNNIFHYQPTAQPNYNYNYDQNMGYNYQQPQNINNNNYNAYNPSSYPPPIPPFHPNPNDFTFFNYPQSYNYPYQHSPYPQPTIPATPQPPPMTPQHPLPPPSHQSPAIDPEYIEYTLKKTAKQLKKAERERKKTSKFLKKIKAIVGKGKGKAEDSDDDSD